MPVILSTVYPVVCKEMLSGFSKVSSRIYPARKSKQKIFPLAEYRETERNTEEKEM